MSGRTTSRWARVYMDGYDMSGYARSIGALNWTFDEANLTALSDAANGYLPAQCNMAPSSINANFDTTATTGLHVIANAAGVARVMSIPIGMRAAPALGDPVYCGRYQQKDYLAAEDGGAMVVNMGFEGWDTANRIDYEIPWGNLLHPSGAETAANTAIGFDAGAASSLGGYLVYHVLAAAGTSTMTATISIDKSTTTNLNASFSALTGATTGSIACSTPTSGIIALPKTTAVGQFLRWQLALGTATSVSFVLSFVRSFK